MYHHFLPVTWVHVELVPCPVKSSHICITDVVDAWANELVCKFRGKVFDALLCQDSHVDLESQQGKHGQWEDSQDDHISEILHRLNDGTDDCFQTCNITNSTVDLGVKIFRYFKHVDFYSEIVRVSIYVCSPQSNLRLSYLGLFNL